MSSVSVFKVLHWAVQEELIGNTGNGDWSVFIMREITEIVDNAVGSLDCKNSSFSVFFLLKWRHTKLHGPISSSFYRPK